MRRFVAFALLAVLAAGCSDSLVRPRVERGIRDSLPEYIGPAKAYTVHSDGSMGAMMRGRIRHLHIEGQDVQLDPNLLVANMTIDMDEIRFNPSNRTVKRVKSTTFEARIEQDSLNRYIAKSREGESAIEIALEKGKVIVSLQADLAGMAIPIRVAGKPVIDVGSKVNFVADSAAVAHLPMPAFVANKVLEGMNPIFDMSTMKFPVTLKEIVVAKDGVTIKGDALFTLGGK